MLGRRHHRVEHQLAVLAAGVALTGERSARDHVVAVDGTGAGEDAVVESEQADHAVRHRPHRHQRGHGERAGAEVGARRPAGHPLAHQRADVRQAQLEARPLGGAEHRGELAVHLCGLPLVAAPDGGQLVDTVADRGQPVGDRVAPVHPVGDRPQPCEALRQPAGEVDAGAPDVVERQRGAEEPVGVVADRDPGEHAVETEGPGVLHVALEAERLAVRGVEGPADAGVLHPPGDGLEVGVGEPEAAAHRIGGQQVQDRAGLGPPPGEVEQTADDGEQRVGLGQRPVGQPDPEPVTGVPADVTHPERGGHQRRVGLDVGAHHEDVARLQGRVVVEQAEHHLAQHLDLARGPVAGVHLDRPVARVDAALVGRRYGVGRKIGLQPAEE